MNRRYRPCLDARLDLGFMGFWTHIMTTYTDRLEQDYIALNWYFFKWGGTFRLYKRTY